MGVVNMAEQNPSVYLVVALYKWGHCSEHMKTEWWNVSAINQTSTVQEEMLFKLLLSKLEIRKIR